MLKKLPFINSAHGSETRNIINEIINAINDRGLEILSESGFLTWLEKNGIKHREEVATFADLPASDSLNTVRGVAEDNKIYIKKENGWVAFQSIDLSKINDLENKMDEVHIYARDFGVVADGTTNNADALNEALNYANGKKIVLPQGNVKVSSQISYDGKVSIVGSGDASVLDLSNGGSLSFRKDLLNIPNLSTNIKKGSSTFKFASNHNLSEGDVFILYNPTNFSWAQFREYYRDGCMFEVDRIISNTEVRIFGVSPDSYRAADMRVFKMRGEGVTLENMKIIPNSSSTSNVQAFIDGHQDVTLSNIKIPRGSTYTAIEVHRCYNVIGSRLDIEVVEGDAYPVSLSNSQKITLSQSPLKSGRHSLAIGGRSGNGCVPSRDILIDQCILMNRSENGNGAADMHGNCENVKYTNCILNTGANMAGKNVRYEDCTIFARDIDHFNDGNCIFGAEVVGGSYEIVNCKLITSGNGQAFGFVHLSTSRLSEDLKLIIKNLYVDNEKTDGNIRLLMLMLGTDTIFTNRIDVEMDGVNCKNDVSQFVNLANNSDISQLSSFIIDNVYCPSGASLLGSSNANNYNAPMRLQKQTGSVDLIAELGKNYAHSETIRFKYPYPRRPHLTLSAYNHGNHPMVGSFPVIPYIQNLASQYVIPGITTGELEFWDAEKTVTVMYNATINEI